MESTNDTKAIAPIPESLPTEREVIYYYRDKHLGEVFPVLEARGHAWWMDAGVKLTELMSCFKRGNTVKQACYMIGITYEQYRDFRLLHHWLPQVIRTYKQLIPLRLKDIILEAAIGDEKKGKKPNAKMALGAIRVFPDVEDDPDFADQKTPIAIPEGGSVVTKIEQAFLDEEGNIVMSRQMKERIKYEPNGNPQGLTD